MRCTTFLPFSLLLLFTLFSATIAGDTLTPGESMGENQTLTSSSGTFVLGFFIPGSSKNRYLGIWYNLSNQTRVWVANRDHPLTEDSIAVLKLTNDGDLQLLNQSNGVVWSSGATNASKPWARLLETGNLVVKDSSQDMTGNYVWQSFDYPIDTMLPGMKLGVDRRSHLDRNLTSWKDSNDPSLGKYSFNMDTHGSPEIYISDRTLDTWLRSITYRIGPWNGLRFSGVPEMINYNMFNFTFVNNQDEVYYRFEANNSSILSRLWLDPSGHIRRLVWIDVEEKWSQFWLAPKDQCDNYATCGPNSVCSTVSSTLCGCLPGFEPKSPVAWDMRSWTDGCVRRKALVCGREEEDFTEVRGVKLPDTSSSTVNMTMNLDECRLMCLKNCSCTAYATADISGSGSGCITWSGNLTDLRSFEEANGQIFHLRLLASEIDRHISDKRYKRRQVAVIVIMTVFIVILLLVAWGWFLWKKKKKTKSSDRGTRMLYLDESSRTEERELPVFDLATIEFATCNFSIGNKIGEGGFGFVYKGVMGDGKEIAVKRLSKNSVQGVDEFMNEVMLIANLQHRNLVRLLGCCIEGEERMLIYEYMPNKSLDAFIFDKTKSALLNWRMRLDIISGIARGLLYLHQDSRFRIIHRDLKASNVLLDGEMIPKISDFGTARIFGSDQMEKTRRVIGTYGYMSPEYAMDGIFSVKSDVFSFGVLILEIMSGTRNRGFYHIAPELNLLAHAWRLWKEGKCLELLDDQITSSCPTSEVSRCIQVGLLCVQEHALDRPTMSSVLLMLSSDNYPLPQPKQPGFCTGRSPFSSGWSSSAGQISCTVNDVTFTSIEGR